MRTVLLLTATGLILVVGLVQGLWTDRWGTSAQITRAVARLEQLPLTLPGWAVQVEKLDERVLRVAGVAGSLMCRCTHRETGRSVGVLIVCGKPGPVSLHTPDVCYGGAGYAMVGEPSPTPFTLPADRTADFWTADFQKTAIVSPQRLRISWSWSAGDGWVAPQRPRWWFGYQPVLFKLYIVRMAPGIGAPTDEDPAADFLRVFLPQLEQHLFANP